MCALMTINVHARDVLENIQRINVTMIEDFGWQFNLRYYFEDDI